MTVPVIFHWDGESMVPSKRFERLCDKQYVVGETYRLVEEKERSRVSHNHFFAAIHDAYENLPESYAVRFIDEDHFRKWALIKAGFADVVEIVLSTEEDAAKLAAFAQAKDAYSIVAVHGPLVRIYTAKSQSLKAMGAAEFQRSKQAVLDVVSGLIGVDAETLMENAGKAA